MAVTRCAPSAGAIALVAGLTFAVDARAEEWSHRGLLRSRDLSPFGLLRLDIASAGMLPLSPGQSAVELQLSYQNTFVLSENVESYLRERDVGRSALRPEDAAAILAFDEDAYYIDGEVGIYDLILRHRLDDRWEAYATVPYIRYGRGLFDVIIESFHDTFGFSQMGRDLVERGRFQLVYRIDDDRQSLLDRPTRGGFSDPVFGLRYDWPIPDPAWQLNVEGAVKIAVDGQRLLLSTGEHDVGLQANATHVNGRHAYYASLGGVYFRGNSKPPNDYGRLIPSLTVGWSYALSDRSSLMLQGYASGSTVEDSTVRELTEGKYYVSIGIKTQRGRTLLNLGIIENVGNFRNSADIAVQAGIAYLLDPD